MKAYEERSLRSFWAAFYDLAARTWKCFSEKDGSQAAAAFSFFAILALISMAILAGAILGMVLKGNPDLLERMQNYISENVPGMSNSIKDALSSSIDLSGILGLIGVLVLLYSGTRLFDSFQVWLNRIWEVEKPGYIKKKLKSLLIIVFFIGIVTAGFLLHYFLLNLRYLSFLILLAIYFIGMMFLYSFPMDIHLGWRKVWAGALFVALLIYPMQALLTWYYASVSGFESIYGSLAGLVLSILAIYYLGYIIYMGAALNRTLDVKSGGSPAAPQEMPG